jgi:formylglycine-generating enzyme
VEKRSISVVIAGATLFAACSLFTSLDDFATPPAGAQDGAVDRDPPSDGPEIIVTTGDGGAGDADAAAAPDGCPSRAGPVPVRIGLPDGGFFCVDATEVTRAQYQQFLDNGSPTNTHPRCTFNASFVPGISLTGPTLPVTGVDWCDAHAFCTWAGKRLCRRLGSAAPLPATSGGSTATELVYACGRGGTRTYPYGSTFNGAACNGATYDAGRPVAVASATGCEGGFEGIFDLSGNLAEWVDACDETADAGANDMCALYSSNYNEPDPGDLRCTTSRVFPRDDRGSAGFRCCGP